MTTTVTTSPEETQRLGRDLAHRHPGGALFYLEGDLGSGKTVFAKGIASAYGVDPDDVASPTFALVHRYGGGERPVYHVDLYRLEDERELEELGLEDLEDERDDKGAALIVEWAERLGRFLRPSAVVVLFEWIDDVTRNIKILEKPQ